MELNLLHKTELKIMSVGLCSVNLSDLASAVAEVLELPSSQVLVVVSFFTLIPILQNIG